ncbi:hypothetical protein EsDP_00002916 [Epichloe bromicola]|uniref:RBR-type E3 ubiquitin transferase n=1 Tax=Epichloe bromicola TaxID=79588 RepID=A0ABQ0CM79_9HYPO
MDSEIDEETLELIIELQVQDARNMIKGKHREGEHIAHAVLTDGDAIKAHVDEEQQATNDREFAVCGQPATGSPGDASADAIVEDEMMRKLIALYFGDNHRPPSAARSAATPRAAQQAGPSSSASASANGIELRRCVACTSDVAFFDTVRCPCSHDYCRDCIAKLFSAAISDESLFPPRCCKTPIPLGLNQIFLPPKLLGTYKAKELEYGTPNRTYCHVPTCSTFVPPAFVRDDVATCVKCRSKTCTICKGKSHAGDCPADTSTLDALRIAAHNGWQRCHSCRSMVDLTSGCNHITCRCGAEFCYVCGVKWKECRCDLWDEDRLTGRANNIVDRDAGARNVRGPERDALFERERQNLAQNHQCMNHSWKGIGGEHRCEVCLNWMPQFIYECQHCRLMACKRCQFNRL